MNSPFSDPPLPTPWWLRDASDQELVRHRKLMDELTKLETECKHSPTQGVGGVWVCFKCGSAMPMAPSSNGPDDGPDDEDEDDADDI